MSLASLGFRPQPLLLLSRYLSLLKGQIRSSRLPLLICLHKDGADQPQGGGFIWEDADYPCSPPDFTADPLQPVRGSNATSVCRREVEDGQALWNALLQPVRQT